MKKTDCPKCGCECCIFDSNLWKCECPYCGTAVEFEKPDVSRISPDPIDFSPHISDPYLPPLRPGSYSLDPRIDPMRDMGPMRDMRDMRPIWAEDIRLREKARKLSEEIQYRR